MKKIQVDTAVAEETRSMVKKKEEEATLQKNESEAIAADAQKDLDEAIPALEAAVASLKSLNKTDIVEVGLSVIDQWLITLPTIRVGRMCTPIR